MSEQSQPEEQAVPKPCPTVKCETCGRRPSMRLGHYIEEHDGGSTEVESDQCPDPIHDLADRLVADALTGSAPRLSAAQTHAIEDEVQKRGGRVVWGDGAPGAVETPLVDPFPDEYPMDDAGVVAICGARVEARNRGEFAPTELQAYRLVCKQAAELSALKASAPQIAPTYGLAIEAAAMEIAREEIVAYASEAPRANVYAMRVENILRKHLHDLPSAAEITSNLASWTPASKAAAKELDELLGVFGKDDPEDCWTGPAKRSIQYVSDIRWDLSCQINRAAILAETNESLRGMLCTIAGYAGTHFGMDEPRRNYEVAVDALRKHGGGTPSDAVLECEDDIMDRIFDDNLSKVRAHEIRAILLKHFPARSGAAVVRPVVQWFAERMEAQLRANDHKGGWRRDTFSDLFRRLLEEAEELRGSATRLDGKMIVADLVREAADVANFAMMLADNVSGNPAPSTASASESEEK